MRLEAEIRRERRASAVREGQDILCAREGSPYWYFHFHEGGKRKKLYIGKTDDPKGEFERRRKAGSGGAGQL